LAGICSEESGRADHRDPERDSVSSLDMAFKVVERRDSLEAVAPVRIRSGLPGMWKE
jgi:hypothetical protein